MQIPARIFVFVAFLAAAMAGAVRADEVGDQLTALVGKYAPSIVTVKLVLKTEVTMGGQNRDNEARVERHGVLVDAAGLVMLASAGLTGENQTGPIGGGNDVQLKITATDIKVVIGQEEKEYNAFVAATDSKVGLAFLQIEDLGDRKLAAIDFGASADTTMGQVVATVSRQTKGFDYTPYFETARVNGNLEKPRKAWMTEGRLGGVGLPVFKFTGQVIGVLTTIADPTRSEDQAGGGGGGGGRGGGRGGRGGGRFPGAGGGGANEFILPGSIAQALIAQARTKAVEIAAERAKQKAEQASQEKGPEGKKSEEKKKTGEEEDDDLSK